jgi:hypothetical protein
MDFAWAKYHLLMSTEWTKQNRNLALTHRELSALFNLS